MSSDGIRCPICGRDTDVMETRRHTSAIRRRRTCVDPSCNGRITTTEIPALRVDKAERQRTEGVAGVLVSRDTLHTLQRTLRELTAVAEQAFSVGSVKPAAEQRRRADLQ